MQKMPEDHLQVVIARMDSAARGPVKAVQMNGVDAKAKTKARLRRPDVSAMKTSRMRYKAP